MPANRVPLPTHGSRKATVLVIEDNPEVAHALRRLLDVWGYDVWVAYTGTDGVQLARARPPDVVLSDIGLPGLDGWDVARELRRHPATAGVRLIAVTGHGSDEDKRHAAEVGYDHLLMKPADPETLRALLAVS
jgi:two-component system CheB/CheR fusion protein